MDYIETIIKRCKENPKQKNPLGEQTRFDREHPHFAEELGESLETGDGSFTQLILEFFRQFPEVKEWEERVRKKEEDYEAWLEKNFIKVVWIKDRFVPIQILKNTKWGGVWIRKRRL